jgi:hypothetical protein
MISGYYGQLLHRWHWWQRRVGDQHTRLFDTKQRIRWLKSECNAAIFTRVQIFQLQIGYCIYNNAMSTNHQPSDNLVRDTSAHFKSDRLWPEETRGVIVNVIDSDNNGRTLTLAGGGSNWTRLDDQSIGRYRFAIELADCRQYARIGVECKLVLFVAGHDCIPYTAWFETALNTY